ncbi:hypothetical protein H4R35_002229 [Dimargaris xerosporica]|nr:hypothetical protein H4R35_002229 [Dimargaris xerosporica]
MAQNPYAGGPQWPADSSPRQPRYSLSVSAPAQPTSPTAWSSDSDDAASASNSSCDNLDHLSDLGADDIRDEPAVAASPHPTRSNAPNPSAPPLSPRLVTSLTVAAENQTAMEHSAEPLSLTATTPRLNSDGVRMADVPSVTEIGELHRQNYAVTEAELKDPDIMSLHDSVIEDVEFSFNSTDSMPNLLSILTGNTGISTEDKPQPPPRPTTLAIDISAATPPQQSPWDSIPPKPAINTAQLSPASSHYLSLPSPIYQPTHSSSAATRHPIESQPTYFPNNVGTFLLGLRRPQSTRKPPSQPQMRARAHSQMPSITIPVGRQTGPLLRSSQGPKSVSARPTSYFPNNLFNRLAAPPRPSIAQQMAASAGSNPEVGSQHVNQHISIQLPKPQSPGTPPPTGLLNDESQLYTPSTMPTTPMDTQPSSLVHPTDPSVYPKRVWNRVRKRITETWVGRPGEDSYTSLHPGSSIDALSALEERIAHARPHHRQSSLPDASEIAGSPTLPRHVFDEMPPTASPALSRYPPPLPASAPANQPSFQPHERLQYPSTSKRLVQQVHREPIQGLHNASLVSDSNISRATLDDEHCLHQSGSKNAEGDIDGTLLLARPRVLSDATPAQPIQPLVGQIQPYRRKSAPLPAQDTLSPCTAATSVGHRVSHGTLLSHTIPDVVVTTCSTNSEAVAQSDAVPYPLFMQNYSLKTQSETLPPQLRNLLTEHTSELRTSLSTYPTPLVHRRSVNAHTVSTISGGGYQSSTHRTPNSMRARPDGTDIYSEALSKGHRRPLNPPPTSTGNVALSSMAGLNVPAPHPAPPLQRPPAAAQPTKRTLAMLKDLLMWPAHPRSRAEQTPGSPPAVTNAPGVEIPLPAHTAVSVYESHPTPQRTSAVHSAAPGGADVSPHRDRYRFWGSGPSIRIAHRKRAEWRTLANVLDKVFPPGIHEPLYKTCFILGFICPPLWWLATWCIPPPRDQIRITRENLRVRRLRQWNKRMAQLSLVIIPIVVFILLIRFKDYSNSPIPLPPHYEPLVE